MPQVENGLVNQSQLLIINILFIKVLTNLSLTFYKMLDDHIITAKTFFLNNLVLDSYDANVLKFIANNILYLYYYNTITGCYNV